VAQFVYTGSMTLRSAFFPDAAGEGIVVWLWDDGADELRRIQTVADIANPSWLAIDAQRLRLYAASELHDSADGTVRAYDIDAGTGRLTEADAYDSAGSATCHVAVSESGKDLAWVNYATLPLGSEPDASFVLCRTDAAGKVFRRSVHRGQTPSPTGRQDRRHAHCALFDTPRHRVLTTDLGHDALYAVSLDEDAGSAPEIVFSFPSGSGPRHIIAHPNRTHFYVVHELAPRIDVLVVDGAGFELAQSVEIGQRDVAQPAGIVLSPDMQHLFASVRGTDEICGFGVGKDGRLVAPQSTTPTARMPRDISFSCDGRHLLIACQDAGEVWAFRYEAETGWLADERVIARTGSPTTVRSFVATSLMTEREMFSIPPKLSAQLRPFTRRGS
jgi:6-phosphogluconolactonase